MALLKARCVFLYLVPGRTYLWWNRPMFLGSGALKTWCVTYFLLYYFISFAMSYTPKKIAGQTQQHEANYFGPRAIKLNLNEDCKILLDKNNIKTR